MTLRRRSFDDDSSIGAGVDELLRRSRALTEQLTPVAAAVAAAAIGGEPAFLVASNLADVVTKAVAHYRCDGVADEVEIQVALNALPVDGDGTYVTRGQVTLSEGAFRIDGPFTIPEGASLIGSGVGTVLYDNDAGDMEIYMEDRSEIGNLSISSDPGA